VLVLLGAGGVAAVNDHMPPPLGALLLAALLFWAAVVPALYVAAQRDRIEATP
jgi:hypothetical protein